MKTGKKKYIIFVIAIVCFGLTLVGGTFAWLTFNANVVNAKYNTTTTCFTIDYTNGNAISGVMYQSSTYKGGLTGSVTMKLNSSCSVQSAIGTIKLNVNSSTGSLLLSEGALKYAVYTDPNGSPAATGTITKTGEMTLYDNFNMTMNAVTYYIYVWLDGTIADNEYVNLPFSGYIYTSATQNE